MAPSWVRESSYCLLIISLKCQRTCIQVASTTTVHSLPRHSGSIGSGVMPISACISRTCRERALVYLRKQTDTSVTSLESTRLRYLSVIKHTIHRCGKTRWYSISQAVTNRCCMHPLSYSTTVETSCDWNSVNFWLDKKNFDAYRHINSEGLQAH